MQVYFQQKERLYTTLAASQHKITMRYERPGDETFDQETKTFLVLKVLFLLKNADNMLLLRPGGLQISRLPGLSKDLIAEIGFGDFKEP